MSLHSLSFLFAYVQRVLLALLAFSVSVGLCETVSVDQEALRGRMVAAKVLFDRGKYTDAEKEFNAVWAIR